MRIFALKEGNFAVDAQKNYTPFSGTPPEQTIALAVQPFAIETAEGIILLDAGLGLTDAGKPGIVSSLEAHGLDPAHVTDILMSHLHKDHTGGLAIRENGAFALTFPEAQIHVDRRELTFALTQERKPSYDLPLLNWLSNQRNLRLTADDQGEPVQGITFQTTGGHSPFHRAFWISNGNETILYGADNLPKESYLRYDTAYKSDNDGKRALELRKQWRAEAREKHWRILFYHDMDQADLVL